MEKNIYIVVGEGRCGKSSLVRALTGVYRYKKTRIATIKGILDIYVWPQSCQEAKYSPEDVLKFINNEDSNYFLITLRLNLTPGMLPFQALDYIKVIQEHYDITSIILIGNQSREELNELVNFIPKPEIIVPNSLQIPVNENASIVRDGWGWL